MNIAVVSIQWRNFGGWASYMKHVYRGFTALGHKCQVIWGHEEGPVRDWRETMDFAHFSKTDFLSHADVIYIACFDEKCEVALAKAIHDSNVPKTVVLHDPRDWYAKWSLEAIRIIKPECIFFMGETDMFTFIEDMPSCPSHLQWFYHPYMRIADGRLQPGAKRAISTARIDWDKRTHYLTAANCGIEMWTGYFDWRYNWKYFKGHIKNHPDYRGKFGVSDEAMRQVYQGSCCMVDMSVIHRGGNRTQYTLLEAMDFGLMPILASDWVTVPNCEIMPGRNFYAAKGVEDIRTAVSLARESGNPYQPENEKVLARHDAKMVCTEILRAIEEHA
jgi:hypothetical protein